MKRLPPPSFGHRAGRPVQVGALARGFTLLELLVALVLLSVIMTGLVSALRTMAQTETRIDERIARLDQERVARHFLGQVLSRVSAALVDDPSTPGKKIGSFQATSDAMVWIGIMPARSDLGGRHYFRLAVESPDTRPEMVLRIVRWAPDMTQPDWNTAEKRVLLPGLTQFKIEAQGDPSDASQAALWPKGWQTGWPVVDVLPQRLRLVIQTQNGDLTPWVFPVYPQILTAPGMGGVVVGGGGS